MPCRSALAAAVLITAALTPSLWTDSGPGITPVCAIQGTGATSPLEGMTVTIEATVTAVFAADLEGFFVQQFRCDGQSASSDGLFVYDPGGLAGADAGDVIQAAGIVKEYRGLTELQLAEARAVDRFPNFLTVGLDPPADPAAAQVYLEAREGMLVSMDPARVVGATNSYGEAYLTPLASRITRFYRDTADGRKIGLETPGSWLALNHGDVVRGAGGPLDWRFGSFMVALASTDDVTVEAASHEPQALAPAPAGALRVATYNLENLFDDVNEPGKSDPVATPAEYRAALARRATSIVSALGGVDILAVQEVENLGVLEDLAAEPPLAAADLEAVLIEGPDARGIDVGLLFNRRRLDLVAAKARQLCVEEKPPLVDIPCSLPGGASGWGLYSRPPLVATFADGADRRLTIIANHFKSKRGGEGLTTPTRVAMAEHNLALVRELKAAAPDVPVLVMGDLNDFEDSAPLRALTGTGELTDPHGVDDYTYVFAGVSEILDYILVEGEAVEILDFGPVHTNVDFAAPEPGSLAEGPRASDHDPVAMTLRLRSPFKVYLPATRNGVARGGAPDTPSPPHARGLSRHWARPGCTALVDAAVGQLPAQACRPGGIQRRVCQYTLHDR